MERANDRDRQCRLCPRWAVNKRAGAHTTVGDAVGGRGRDAQFDAVVIESVDPSTVGVSDAKLARSVVGDAHVAVIAMGFVDHAGHTRGNKPLETMQGPSPAVIPLDLDLDVQPGPFPSEIHAGDPNIPQDPKRMAVGPFGQRRTAHFRATHGEAPNIRFNLAPTVRHSARHEGHHHSNTQHLSSSGCYGNSIALMAPWR
jgi:hypothetical protein